MADIRNAAGVPKTHKGFLWSKIIDAMVGVTSVAQGDVLYRNASVWTRLAAGTSGKALTTNGAAANPSWETITTLPNATLGIYKTSDETKTSDTTLADDTVLVCTLSANKKYRLEFDVWFSTAAAPDFKYDLNFTGTTTSILIKRHFGVLTTASLPTGDSTSTFSMRGESALNVLTTFAISASDTIPLSIIVAIEVGASGGTFSFRWAQGTSSLTATTVRRNSTLLVTDAF